MEEQLTLTERIQKIMDEPRWSQQDKEIIIDRIKRRWSWIELIANLGIQMSPEETKTWAEDVKTYTSSTPSAFLQYMNTWAMPDNRTSYYAWNNFNADRTPTGIIGDTDSNRRFFQDWGDRNHVLEYIQYLRILHNYLDQVEVPKQVFGNVPNHLFNTDGWYRKALMNGSLLYRKLLENGAIKYGTKLNLWESFSRPELLGLVGLDSTGKEMSGEQHAKFIQEMATTYINNNGKKKDPNEPLPEAVPEEPIITQQQFIWKNIAQNEIPKSYQPNNQKSSNTTISKKSILEDDEYNDLDSELKDVIRRKEAVMNRVERSRQRLPFRKRLGIALADNFVFWRQNIYEKIDKKYDAEYAAIVDRKYPQKSLREITKEVISNWWHKDKQKQTTVTEAEPMQQKDASVTKKTQEQVAEQTPAQTPVVPENVLKQPEIQPKKTTRKRVSKQRKVLNDWRVARTSQPKISKSAETPIIKQETQKNGDVITVAFYPKANKIIRSTEEFDSGMKKVDTIFIERKRDGIYGRVATYYERVRLNAQGERVVEHLASLTGQMTYGRAGIYVNSHDGIARKISYLSPDELEIWKNKMTEVKISEHKRKTLERIKTRSAINAARAAAMQKKMARAS